MKPDHEAALAKCRAWPHKSNTAACYLDAMARLKAVRTVLGGYKDSDLASLATTLKARLDKATELLGRSLDVFEEANIWGTLNDDIRAFLDERKTDDKQS